MDGVEGIEPSTVTFLLLFLPPQVGLWESQFGQTSRRFSILLSCFFPLIWSRFREMDLPLQSLSPHS